MKYEFHVGDYVETVGGFVGWISAMRDNEYIIVVDKNNNTCGYYIPQESRYFNRIGQYDFTKPEQPKEIEKLSNDIRATFTINDKSCHIRQYTGEEWAYMCYPKEFIDKINELIDVVNELKTDHEKHLRAHELTER